MYFVGLSQFSDRHVGFPKKVEQKISLLNMSAVKIMLLTTHILATNDKIPTKKSHVSLSQVQTTVQVIHFRP